MSKVNTGQAPSTLIPKYIGSDFDKVIAVADNIEDVITVAGSIDDVGIVADNIGYVQEVAEDLHGMPVTMFTGDTAPVLDPMPEGMMWYCTTDGRTYVWYVDEDSGQWVESAPQSAMQDEATNIFFHAATSNMDPAYRSATLATIPTPEQQIQVAHNLLETPVLQAQFIRDEALWVDVSVTGAQGLVTLMGYASGNVQMQAEVFAWEAGALGASLGQSMWVTMPSQPTMVSLPVTLANIDVLDAGDSYVIKLSSKMVSGGSAVSTIVVDGNSTSRFGIIFDTNLIGLFDGIRDGVVTSAPTENAVFDALRTKVGEEQLAQAGEVSATASWAPVPLFSDPELGGADGLLNAQAEALAARTELLKVRSDGLTYAGFRAYNGIETSLDCIGRTNVFDGAQGHFLRDDSDTTSADDDATILVDALGRRWKRQWTAGVMPEWWGAKGDAIALDDLPVKKAFDYAYSKGQARMLVVGAVGAIYLVSQTVNIRSHFDGKFSVFKAAPTFTGTAVLRVTETSLRAKDVFAAPNNAAAKVPFLVGFHVDAYNFKGNAIGANGFDYGLMVTSFSCTMRDCAITGNNTNVTAYAPTSSREINALQFIGGEYWGGRDYSFNIGDARFSSTVVPASNHGHVVKILGCTTDGSVMCIDRVTEVEVSCYFEAGVSTVQDSYIRIPNTNGTMGGFNVHDCYVNNSAGTMQYFVKGEAALKGFSVDRIFYSAIPKCVVYMPSQDIYQTYIGALMPTNSHTLAPAIHLGMRTNQPFGFNKFTILGQIANGVSGPLSKYLMAGIKHAFGNGVNKRYAGSGWVNIEQFGREFVGTVVGSNAFHITNASDMVALEAGMCVRLGPSGTGTHTYILRCDYETNTIYLDNFTLTSQTVLSAKEDKAFFDFESFQMPTTTTGYELGSRCWNTYTVTQTPAGWTLNNTGWVAFT